MSAFANALIFMTFLRDSAYDHLICIPARNLIFYFLTVMTAALVSPEFSHNACLVCGTLFKKIAKS